MPVPTLYQQSGWLRPHPKAVCQDHAALLKVSEYDYDLDDDEFRLYAKQRAVIHLAGVPGSPRWNMVSGKAGGFHGFALFSQLPNFALAQADANGNRYRYSPRELYTQWEIIQLARAKLQDLWEIWQRLSHSDTPILSNDSKACEHTGLTDCPASKSRPAETLFNRKQFIQLDLFDSFPIIQGEVNDL